MFKIYLLLHGYLLLINFDANFYYNKENGVLLSF